VTERSTLVVYGDFNCPYSCLASARVDVLVDRGIADVEWRAVEHDVDIPVPSRPADGELGEMFDREVAEVSGLLRDGEVFPIARPPVQPNTAIAVAAFAAVSAGDAHAARRKLFAALWFDGLDTGDSALVRELTGVDQPDAGAVVAAWRDEWLDLERRLVPMLVLPDGYVSRGLGALARLADLAELTDLAEL
jgi:2-hydroxychromene-2-carboxylate isomerase